MVSPKRQFNMLFERNVYTNNEKLQVLNNLIENTQSIDDQVKYYSKRACVHFDDSNWEEALSDITFVETHRKLNHTLILIKCKSAVRLEMGKIHDWFKKTLQEELIDNEEHLALLDQISAENMTQFTGRGKKRSTGKRMQI